MSAHHIVLQALPPPARSATAVTRSSGARCGTHAALCVVDTPVERAAKAAPRVARERVERVGVIRGRGRAGCGRQRPLGDGVDDALRAGVGRDALARAQRARAIGLVLRERARRAALPREEARVRVVCGGAVKRRQVRPREARTVDEAPRQREGREVRRRAEAGLLSPFLLAARQ